jgi:hypothetical protein
MAKSKAKSAPVEAAVEEVKEKKELKFPATLVRPSIIFEGDELHPLQEILSSDPKNWPEIKAVGYMRLPRVYDRKATNKVKDTGNFVSYIITIRGAEVVSIDVEQPDLRAIAEEATKIAFVDQFMQSEEL